MGVSEARMRKLMEGRGAGKPGVAGKVGALLQTIRAGGWCEEQASLMRGLAYGMLDPEGERYQLALAHGRECPACRAYVVSLRGLAAALPPVLMGPALGAATLGGVVAGSGVGGGMPLGQLGVVSASGAAGAGSGAAGGSWLLAGPLANVSPVENIAIEAVHGAHLAAQPQPRLGRHSRRLPVRMAAECDPRRAF